MIPCAPTFVVVEYRPLPLSFLSEASPWFADRPDRYEWRCEIMHDGTYSCCRSYYCGNCPNLPPGSMYEAHGHTVEELHDSIRTIHEKTLARRRRRE